MPQPIDAQSELARTTMAQRVQDLAGRAALVQAQRNQVEADQARDAAIRTVDETAKAQSEHVDEDGRRKNPFVGRRRRRKGLGGVNAASTEGNENAKVFYTSGERTRLAEDSEGHQLDITV